MKNAINTEITVPAGEYWLGDPCYSVPSNDWMPWLRAADFENERYVLWAKIPGTEHWVLGLTTQYGDGCYTDEQGNKYGVDAGLIGLVPVACNPTTNFTLDENGVNEFGAGGIARKVTFDRPTRCFIDTDGAAFRKGRHHVLTFGSIRIETGDGDDEVCEHCGYDLYECDCDEDES